ncbi:hypothetical protein K438DRAFT_2170018 [Mycena galopus ATCC 62051]|nr:hypothetical protein K438DRAFT_2170018 [Mycena galopus ATCC 62051]
MRKTWAANLFINVFRGKAKQAWYKLSPKKAHKWLSPRKKKREDKTHNNAPIIETRPFDTSHDPIHNVSHDPFDVSMQSINIPGFTLESPVAMPAAHEYTWKLPKPPKPTVEERLMMSSWQHHLYMMMNARDCVHLTPFWTIYMNKLRTREHSIKHPILERPGLRWTAYRGIYTGNYVVLISSDYAV